MWSNPSHLISPNLIFSFSIFYFPHRTYPLPPYVDHMVSSMGQGQSQGQLLQRLHKSLPTAGPEAFIKIPSNFSHKDILGSTTQLMNQSLQIVHGDLVDHDTGASPIVLEPT